MVKTFLIHNIVNPKTGLTIKEENLRTSHNIPIGTLVEVKWDRWFGDGACWKVHARLWVIGHRRDCDGTPLYSLSEWNFPWFSATVKSAYHGFGEESLTPVELTDEVRQGEDVLEWENS